MPSFINSVTEDYLKKTIRMGRPGRIMPAFNKLSAAQINAIVVHMRSWTDKPVVEYDPAPVKGDAGHGKQLFASYCAQCHGDRGAGRQRHRGDFFQKT